jgi:chromosome segregation ATPase
MTLPELLDYFKGRYGVTETHPQVVQVVERFNAEVARQQAEHAAEEAEKQAQQERYQQLYAPFRDMDREDLIDEINRLRSGEEGQLFRQVLAEKDATIERLESEVAELEAQIETHDERMDALDQQKREAYRLAKRVLGENDALREEVASLRATVEAHGEMDAHDGYPRKAGHFIASMTYRHGRLPLAGPGQLLDLG